MTERAVKLTSNDKFFALAFHHTGLNTLPTGSLTATIQVNRLSTLKIKQMLADPAF